MSELLENEEQVVQAEEQVVQAEEQVAEQAEVIAEEAAAPFEGELVAEPAPKKKLTKKKLIIIGAIALAVIVLLFVIFGKSKFERVKDEAVQIAGMISSGKGYFTIDTYPDHYENMDPTVRMMLVGRAQENALEAIQYVNGELGFNGSVYSRMLKTNALMGRQSEENDKYKVSWTYHPDDGLEVTYEKK